MEPLLPTDSGLNGLAVDVLQAAAALGASVAPGTRRGLVDLLRVVNCYYSNRIEGHDTRPADIERAMRDDYAEDRTVRALQREARAHIEVQRLVEGWLAAEPMLDVTSTAFLCRVHLEFYSRVPEELRYVAHPVTGRAILVVPGALRTERVQVSLHVPPAPEDLAGLLARFSEGYALPRLSRVTRVLALAASHHRLVWIHPFLDGNGRAARLFSTAYAIRAGLEGEGLWSIARGLARRRTDYLATLAAADAARLTDYDGRGARSHAALFEFCTYFLTTCLDQIAYMRELLKLETFGDRLMGYAALRARGAAALPSARSMGDASAPPRGAFREEAGLLLRDAMLRGEVTRGEAARITGLGDRTARSMVSALVREGLLVSDSPKGAVRLGYPTHAVPYFFPLLYPEESADS